MSKEAWVALVSSVLGLLIGIGTAYTVLKIDDAVLKEKVASIELCTKQQQRDINILHIELSKTQTEMKNTDESYKSLQKVIKEMAKSNKDLAIAITRLDERQRNFETFIKKYLGDSE